jgi:fluoride ion exporter CrcB/FEX
MNISILLGVAGAIGGAIRSFLGYQTQSDFDEGFDYMKMAQSIARAAVVGFAAGYMLPPETDFVMALLIATGVGVGGDVVIKEGTSTIKEILGQ